MSRQVALVLAMVGLVACGKGEPGPTAAPAAVVKAAPDRTLAAATAKVSTTGPYVAAVGTVAFAPGTDDLTLSGRRTTSPPWGVTQPAATLDLLRGVVDVYAYGGAQVQGFGTKRYEVDIDVAKAIAATPAQRQADLELLVGKVGNDGRIWADLFVDSTGRVRRILVPVQTASERPYGDSKMIPQLVSVDFSDFGKGGR